MAEIERAKKQKADVSEIRKSGGAAFFDWQLHAFDSLRTQEPPLPVWLRELLGEDFFASVVEVHLEPCSIPDALLSHVKALPQLRDLDIEGIELTDTQLEHIGELIQLRFLAIRYPKVSGCERKGLNALTQLEGLYIFHPPITDAGLQRLKRFARLQILELRGTRVTGAGLEDLKSLPYLHELSLCEKPGYGRRTGTLQGIDRGRNLGPPPDQSNRCRP